MSQYRTAPAAALLGALLVRAGAITQEQLEDAVAAQAEAGLRLGEILMARGWLTQRALAGALAEQFGLEFLDLRETPLDEATVGVLPAAVAREHTAVAVGHDEAGRLVVAISDPADAAGFSAIRAATRDDVRFVVAERDVVEDLLARALSGRARPEER
jgi:type IV pilus assembly protein PilB